MRSIVNMSPWSELNRVWDLMDRISPIQDFTTTSSFPIDMFEQEGKLIVKASLPGIKSDDVAVSLDQGVLTVSGERKNEYESKEGSRIVHREHSYGSFVRSVRLPDNIDENKIDARFEDGILTVTIPEVRNPDQAPKQIPVRTTAIKSGSPDFAYVDRPGQK